MNRVLRHALINVGLVVAAFGASMLAGCGSAEDADGVVLVLAAASVGEPMEEIGRAYQVETGNRVGVSVGGSNVLARQILAGAPGDLFLSANELWADEVMDAGRGVEVVALLGNALVLVVPAGNPAGVVSPHDLAQPGVRRIAMAGEHVPAGMYGERALRRLGMYAAVEGKVVRGESVRFALAYVERGEAEAGVVYATDAAASDDVEVVFEFDLGGNRIVYPLVLLERGAEREAARGLFEFMRGEEGAKIFEWHGFRVLGAGGGAREDGGDG